MTAKKKKSTTRSDTSLESLNLYTFFLDRVDRALESNTLRTALQALGARVKLHRDYFKDDQDDEVWLPAVDSRVG